MAATTRDRLLDASGELFRRQGYTGTGVKQILAQASAPFGSLYHHFPGGKEELGAETIRRSGRLYAIVVAKAMDVDGDMADRVLAGFLGAAETMRESGYADACPIARSEEHTSELQSPVH